MNSTIPFVDLKQQYATLKPAIDAAIASVIGSCDFILGKSVAEFEQAFAEFLGVSHAVGVGSGTDALFLALKCLKIEKGAEVITAANTYIATVLAISHAGATPVLADVNPNDFCLDPEAVARAITPRTKAIIPVHLYGNPAAMDAIMDLAHKHNLNVIEDACQAHAAKIHDRCVGTIGDIGCFSFYPGKNLGAYGDGGLVVTNSQAHAEVLRLLRNYGQQPKNHHILKGFNSRLDSVQAAILLAKLPYLETWNRQRRNAAALYRAGLAGLPVAMQTETAGTEHVYHIFAILTEARDQLATYLNRHNIQCGSHYPVPIHLQPAYRDLGCGIGSFPHAERQARSCLSLPIFPEITAEQIARICLVIRDFFKQGTGNE